MDIPVVVHVIVGLPGENANDNLACAKYLSHLNINGVKIQLLHILKILTLQMIIILQSSKSCLWRNM